MWTYPTTLLASVESGMTDPLTEGDYTNLLGWWDFSDNSTVLDSGGSPVTGGNDVYKVTDKKGNLDLDGYDSTSTLPSYDPGNSAYQANGKDGLIFSGDTLGTTSVPTYSSVTQYSVFMCFHLQSVVASRSPVGHRIGSSNRGGWWFNSSGEFGAVQGTQTSFSSAYAMFDVSPNTTSPHVYGNRNDWGASSGPTIWSWYDDGSSVNDTGTNSWVSISNGYNKINIGAKLNSAVTETIDLYCYEMLLYDGAISDENAELAMNYLLKKYGV